MLRIKSTCDKISTVRSNKLKYKLFFENDKGIEYSKERYLDVYKFIPKRGVNENIEEINEVKEFLERKNLTPIERHSDGSIIVTKESSMPSTKIKRIEKINNDNLGEIIYK